MAYLLSVHLVLRFLLSEDALEEAIMRPAECFFEALLRELEISEPILHILLDFEKSSEVEGTSFHI